MVAVSDVRWDVRAFGDGRQRQRSKWTKAVSMCHPGVTCHCVAKGRLLQTARGSDEASEQARPPHTSSHTKRHVRQTDDLSYPTAMTSKHTSTSHRHILVFALVVALSFASMVKARPRSHAVSYPVDIHKVSSGMHHCKPRSFLCDMICSNAQISDLS